MSKAIEKSSDRECVEDYTEDLELWDYDIDESCMYYNDRYPCDDNSPYTTTYVLDEIKKDNNGLLKLMLKYKQILLRQKEEINYLREINNDLNKELNNTIELNNSKNTETSNVITDLQIQLKESMSTNNQIIHKYDHSLRLMKGAMEKNSKLMKLLSESDKKLKKLELEKEDMNRQSQALCHFFQDCVIKMDILLENYKGNYTKRIHKLKQKLVAKTLELTLQKEQFHFNGNTDLNYFIYKMRNKYRTVLEKQFHASSIVMKMKMKMKRGSDNIKRDEHSNFSLPACHGETILKYNVAQKIISAMERGLAAQEATENIIKAMTKRLNNTAGAITLSNKGDVGVYFSSERMSWAYLKNGEIHFGIEQGQHEIELV